MTTEEFITRAKAIHGDKYDYSISEYTGQKEKVKIICSIHGIFEQQVGNHLQGKGCARCSGTVKLTTEEFIRNARLVHGEKYDYSETGYVNSGTKVRIICKEHGVFCVKPYHHTAGVGCPPCSWYEGASDRTLGKEEFVRRATAVHGNKYNYDRVDYVNNSKPVEILCSEHGYFMQAPSSHFDGRGCNQCNHPDKMFDTESCIKKFIKVHGNRYDYSKVNYVKNSSRVEIICKAHGSFLQTPANHSFGEGCPSCAKAGIRYSLPTLLYVIKSEELTKVGISNNKSRHKSRLQNIRRESQRDFKSVCEYDFSTGYFAAEVEGKILSWMKSKYKPTSLSFAGRTECFEDVNLPELINQIELLIEECRGNY